MQAQNIGITSVAGGNDTCRKLVPVLASELSKVKGISAYSAGSNTPGSSQVIIATCQELQQMKISLKPLKKLSGMGTEAAGIYSNGSRLYLTGNSAMAVQHAVFQYLYLSGFRYYFPQEEWFIVPATLDPLRPVIWMGEPAFAHRRVWYAYGGGSDEVENRFLFWVKANRLGGSMQAAVGHAYDVIVDRNKNAFLQHPGWLANMTTPGVLPPNPKFNVADRELTDFIIRDTKAQLAQLVQQGSPAQKMISMSPSDDLGVCNTPACQQLGTVTDRVFYLVNNVAKAIRKEYPQTLIGCLAYSEYIAPPTREVEDNVYVSLTTAYNNSSYSTDELITRWRKKTKKLGMYDYQALYAWDYDLPGQCMASAFHTIAPALSGYATRGLTGYEAEFNTGWVNKGLGYYISSRLLWDPSENADAIVKDFFEKCFPSSRTEIAQLYDEWSRFNDPFIGEATLTRWADLLLAAQAKEKDPVVQKRLSRLTDYLQYIVLYNNYKSNPGQATLAALLEQAKLNINNENLAYYPAMVVLGERLNGFNINTVIRDNRAKPFQAPTVQQSNGWLRQYRQQRKAYRQYALPAPAPKLGPVPGGKTYTLGLHDVREDQNSYIGTTWFVFEKKATDTSWMDLQADFIVGGGSKLPVQLSIYPFGGYAVPASKPMWQQAYTERKKWIRYPIGNLKPGIYVLKIEDPKKGFQLKLSADINYSLFIPDGQRVEVGYMHCLYFYVPPGTTSFRFMKSKTMKLIDPYGKVYDYANNKQEEIEITPAANQAGIWRLMGVAEFFKPEGVYPVFGIIPSRMLYPQ